MAGPSQQFDLSASKFDQADPDATGAQCNLQNEIASSTPGADINVQKVQIVMSATAWLMKQVADQTGVTLAANVVLLANLAKDAVLVAQNLPKAFKLGADAWDVYKGQIVPRLAEFKAEQAKLANALSNLNPTQFEAFARDFANSTNLTAQVARQLQAVANRVWQLPPTLRGDVIENAVTVLDYLPKGYDWVGIMKRGWLRQIDFYNAAANEVVSLKTTFPQAAGGWASSIKYLENVITDLADDTRRWQTLNPGLTKTVGVLDVRVPNGYQGQLQSLVDFGKQLGIVVRIGTF